VAVARLEGQKEHGLGEHLLASTLNVLVAVVRFEVWRQHGLDEHLYGEHVERLNMVCVTRSWWSSCASKRTETTRPL